MTHRFKLRAVAAAVSMTLAGVALASSHREAPFITNLPKVDASDFYLFNSYEAGRTGYVTLIANYLPLQEPYGGPNYFQLDPQALYEIHVDNNGDGAEDLTFQFRFTKTTQGLAVMAGGKSIPVPLTNIGPVSATDSSAQNVAESYTLTLVKGDRRHGTAAPDRRCEQRVDNIHQAVGQHRRQVDSGLRRPTPPASSTPSPFRAAAPPARCSSGSARIPSW